MPLFYIGNDHWVNTDHIREIELIYGGPNKGQYLLDLDAETVIRITEEQMELLLRQLRGEDVGDI